MARAVVAGVPHHVTQRGNGRRTIFDTDADRLLYLDLLRENAVECDLAIWAWCLMSNHVHLVAVPGRPDSLARTLGRTHAAYARYLNIRRRSCGHLFQARFYSCPIGPQHLWTTVAYVERNPQRAGLVAVPWDYLWSSARVHVANDVEDRLVDLRAVAFGVHTGTMAHRAAVHRRRGIRPRSIAPRHADGPPALCATDAVRVGGGPPSPVGP